jgi:hypothetical protein
MGFVVWPSDTAPAYQITPVDKYRSDHVRKPGLRPGDLEAAIRSAEESLDLAPPNYAVFVVVE